ncbi:MAG: hypothetical protein CMK89_00960 [Pseudomonadales bacterium]|nr:hypothetical protein [Pseudomonadales bacterium]
MFAIARIPASQCDRNINVRVVARAIYETPGDPWVSLEVKIPGIISPWNSGRLGVPAESPSYRDAKFNQTISLPAGQSMDVIANTANFRAKADFLRIEADITEP